MSAYSGRQSDPDSGAASLQATEGPTLTADDPTTSQTDYTHKLSLYRTIGSSELTNHDDHDINTNWNRPFKYILDVGKTCQTILQNDPSQSERNVTDIILDHTFSVNRPLGLYRGSQSKNNDKTGNDVFAEFTQYHRFKVDLPEKSLAELRSRNSVKPYSKLKLSFKPIDSDYMLKSLKSEFPKSVSSNENLSTLPVNQFGEEKGELSTSQFSNDWHISCIGGMIPPDNHEGESRADMQNFLKGDVIIKSALNITTRSAPGFSNYTGSTGDATGMLSSSQS
ncbi:uncharacterized protein L201_007796 [Kwoniella dendrophila CBS 6074]|uniref:Uncharacterized protein n=1 Tax=Kwoniella dendrophila CBS 6074 TaxID=1295534 RepID=A0AAX4K5B7_9TREE